MDGVSSISHYIRRVASEVGGTPPTFLTKLRPTWS